MSPFWTQLFALCKPFDWAVLRWLNVTLTHAELDRFWDLITQLHKSPVVKFAVLPIILFFWFYTYGWRALAPILALALTIGLTDLIAYRVIKAEVNRPRPFQTAEVMEWSRKVGDAGGSSFPSNHAANCFAGASILAFYFRRPRHYFYIFAALVGASRVALGVHYPTDVLVGILLGSFVAFLVKTFVLTRGSWLWLSRPVPKAEDNSRDWRTRSRRMSGV